MSRPVVLLLTAAVLFVLAETTVGFALRVYPGFAPYSQDAQLVQEQTRDAPVEGSNNVVAALPTQPNPEGFKSLGFRRGGPLDDCTSYLECKSRLISYLDVMKTLSNKG